MDANHHWQQFSFSGEKFPNEGQKILRFAGEGRSCKFVSIMNCADVISSSSKMTKLDESHKSTMDRIQR